ncbi:ribonuclease Y, partial [Chloroflexota bacterium]
MESGPVFYILLSAILVIGIVFGAMTTFLLSRVWITRRLRVAERRSTRIVVEAKNEATNMLREAREEVGKVKSAGESEHRERRSELQRLENRLSQKSEGLDRKLEGVEHRERSLTNRETEAESIRAQLEETKDKQLKQLEAISGMSSNEAKQILIDKMEAEMEVETARRLRAWEDKLKEESKQKAQEILSQAIQRCASEVVSETTIASVPIPSDEMKGRLIGREGRNIRALEQATGVDLIIDDTPEAVTLSSFDPVRREVARQALTKLVLDGRIHPARIEEVVNKTKEEVDAIIYSAGEQAAYQVGVHGLRPELIKILGRLKYRTSYGQNVLNHSIEVAYLAEMIASELGANANTAKKTGLLHDLGKAVDREVEGTHAAIGADLVKQWDKSPEVVQGIAEHHGET